MFFFLSVFHFFVFIKVGVMAEAEMEEVARTDFQEEPGMMERSTHLSLVTCFTSKRCYSHYRGGDVCLPQCNK